MTTRIGIANFRRTLHEIREPVEVLRGTETVGFFYPGSRMPMITVPGAERLPDNIGWVGETPTKIEPGFGPQKLPDQKLKAGKLPEPENTKFTGFAPVVETPDRPQERFNTQAFKPVPKTGKMK